MKQRSAGLHFFSSSFWIGLFWIAVYVAGWPGLTGRLLGAGTNFLDADRVLAGLAEKQWYKDNIPLLDIPDGSIQQTYYYRWSAYKRHIHYTEPGQGYIISEFAHVPGYAGAFGAINAAAGHHIYEGRWLRNQRYLDDYEIFWMRG